MKILIVLTLLFQMRCLAFSLVAEVDKLDSASYSVIADSKNVVYLEKCTRARLCQYEWKVWEGHYGIRSYVQAIANITVKKEDTEIFTPETRPFIEKAIEESAKIGGHIICYVSFKKPSYAIGFESITFRAYKQFFLSGNKAWETYFYEKIAKGPPLTVPDLKKE